MYDWFGDTGNAACLAALISIAGALLFSGGPLHPTRADAGFINSRKSEILGSGEINAQAAKKYFGFACLASDLVNLVVLSSPPISSGCIASDDPLFREKGFLLDRQVHPRRDNFRFFPAPVPFPAGRFQVPAGGRSPQDLHDFFKGGVLWLPDDDRAHLPAQTGLREQDLRGDLLRHDTLPRDAFQASDFPKVPKERQGGNPSQEPGARGMQRAGARIHRFRGNQPRGGFSVRGFSFRTEKNAPKRRKNFSRRESHFSGTFTISRSSSKGRSSMPWWSPKSRER